MTLITSDFKPGAVVQSIERIIWDSHHEFTIDSVITWLAPDDNIPDLWKRRKDIKLVKLLTDKRAPNMLPGRTALIIARVPRKRTWIMLLLESGSYCWVYSRDGLEVLSPA